MSEFMTEAMQSAAWEAARQHQRRADEAVRRLLSRWVSGLEPQIAMDEQYRVIGLNHGGQIVLHDDE